MLITGHDLVENVPRAKLFSFISRGAIFCSMCIFGVHLTKGSHLIITRLLHEFVVKKLFCLAKALVENMPSGMCHFYQHQNRNYIKTGRLPDTALLLRMIPLNSVFFSSQISAESPISKPYKFADFADVGI